MKTLLMPWTIFLPALRHSLAVFESLLDRGDMRNLILSILGLVVFWHVYTPIHELLHAGACLLGGGTVEELAIKAQYGGALLQHVFPFVVAESDYAGQLTGFSTPNDWVYAFVDLAPYILSLAGLGLIEWCRRSGRAFLFGLGILLAYIPFMSVTGDYYELVSLATTRLTDGTVDPRILVSDDVFKLIGDLKQGGQLTTRHLVLVVLGMAGSIYAALMTLACQVLIARRIYGPEVLAVTLGPTKAGTAAEPA